jgi:glucosyl-dolichyl phosphate glucuronosyltransferase
MTMQACDVSMIICTCDEERWADLAAAVDSLQRQTVAPREILLVVDHNPRLLSRVRRSFPKLQVVANSEAQGLSGARNSGAAAAQGNILGFLDDDATAAPDLIQLLRGWLDSTQVLGAGGTAEPVWQRPRPGWFPDEFLWVVGCSYRGQPRNPSPVRNVFGGNMLIRRAVFASAGGLSSALGRVGTRLLGCEETELCIRAEQRNPGGVFIFEPRARIFHQAPAKRTTLRYFCARCYGEGISKARLAQRVGKGASLTTEKTYIRRVLPQGILRGLAETLQGDLHGVQRSGAIVLGLAHTIAGYLAGQLSGGTS